MDEKVKVEFDFSTGTEVLTRFNEQGFVDMLGVNNRGEKIYLIELEGGATRWSYPNEFTVK